MLCREMAVADLPGVRRRLDCRFLRLDDVGLAVDDEEVDEQESDDDREQHQPLIRLDVELDEAAAGFGGEQ